MNVPIISKNFYYGRGGGYSELQSAAVTQTTTNVLDLQFNRAATITTDGWSIATDGAALSITSVIAGDGTTTPKFSLSRAIVPGEVITISYNATTGSSNILEDITDFAVTNNVHIWLEVPFTGTVVDTNKGAITNPDSANLLVSQNASLQFKRVTDTAISTHTNYWESVMSLGRGVFSATMNKFSGFISGNCRFAYHVDDNNRIHVSQVSNRIFLVVVVAGVAVYNFDTTITFSFHRVKVVYEDNNDIKFYHYTGGAWVQLGTTQNFNVGASGKIRCATNSSSSDDINDLFAYDGVYVTDEDYTTETPGEFFL